MPASRSLLLRLLVALAALTLLTAACGGDDSGDDDAAATDGTTDDGDDGDGDDGGSSDFGDACDLVTLAELEAAFGFAWSEGESTDVAAGSAQCVWNDADEALPVKIVSLAVGNDDTFEDAFHQSAKQIFDNTKALLSDDEILEDDLGIGDHSYRTAGGIYVLDGDTYYSVNTIGGTSDEAVAGLKAMAAAAVDG